MPFARPFAYNTGAPVPGTLQLGDLAIGVTASGYNSGYGGLRWWNGPNEDLGYIICNPVPSGTQPNPDNEQAYVGFKRSPKLTESSFVTLANNFPGSPGNFGTGSQAKTWLNSNGYWTSWGDLDVDNVLYLDASKSASYPGSGSTWFDLSGNGNNGTISGATFDSSGCGTFSFDGTNDYVSTPLVTTNTTTVTIEGWFNSDNVNQAGQMVAYIGSDANINGYGFAVNNEGSTSGNIFVLYGGIAWYNTGVNLISGVWYQVTMTISGSSLTIYLNGAQVYSATSLPSPNTPTLYTEIGRNDFAALRYFNGLISVVKIWNRVLTLPEISSEWENYKNCYSSLITNGLIMQLDADNSSSYPGSGTTVFDITGSYNHTLTNAPYTLLNGIKCFDTNGTSSTIIEVNGTGPTLPTSGYTYITWARVRSSSATWRTLFRTLPNDHPILVELGSDNLGFYDNDTNLFVDSGYDVTQIEDVWVQFTVVGDNASSAFYINGTQVGTTAKGAGGNRHWAWGAITGQPFGYVANLYLYNRKLNSSEIIQQYNYLSPRFD